MKRITRNRRKDLVKNVKVEEGRQEDRSLLAEIAGILLSIAVDAAEGQVLKLLQALHSTNSDIDTFKSGIKGKLIRDRLPKRIRHRWWWMIESKRRLLQCQK